MTLTKPVFVLDKPNPSEKATDATWWLWLRLHELEPRTKLGGIYAAKPGFHRDGNHHKAHRPNDYSIRDKVNQVGLGMTHASAIDWTFPDAQAGNFVTIDKYTSRLMKSALDSDDPRLDLIVFEFYGQADSDRAVEGYNEFREEKVSSDPSHLWHLHISFKRSRVGEFWGMWALLTVLMGWSVDRWKESLPEPPKTSTPKPTPTGLPVHKPGSRENSTKAGNHGTDVRVLQAFMGKVTADGRFGDATKARLIEYQKMRGLTADGIAGPKTWAPILKALK